MILSKEIELLHIMAVLAELAVQCQENKTFHLHSDFDLVMYNDRVCIIHKYHNGYETVCSATHLKERNPDITGSPFIDELGYFLYNYSNSSILTVCVDDEADEIHDAVNVDFRNPESESTVFQLGTIMPDHEVIGLALHSQMYNYLPNLIVYRRVHPKMDINYDSTIQGLFDVIEVLHGR